MTRIALDSRDQSTHVCDRYFVTRIAATGHDAVDRINAAAQRCQREVEETGRPLAEILTDLRVSGSL